MPVLAERQQCGDVPSRVDGPSSLPLVVVAKLFGQVSREQHGEIQAAVPNIDVSRTEGGVGSVDDSSDPVAAPQDVEVLVVTMHEAAMAAAGSTGGLDRCLPEMRPVAPRRWRSRLEIGPSLPGRRPDRRCVNPRQHHGHLPRPVARIRGRQLEPSRGAGHQNGWAATSVVAIGDGDDPRRRDRAGRQRFERSCFLDDGLACPFCPVVCARHPPADHEVLVDGARSDRDPVQGRLRASAGQPSPRDNLRRRRHGSGDPSQRLGGRPPPVRLHHRDHICPRQRRPGFGPAGGGLCEQRRAGMRVP